MSHEKNRTRQSQTKENVINTCHMKKIKHDNHKPKKTPPTLAQGWAGPCEDINWKSKLRTQLLDNQGCATETDRE